MQRLPLVRIRNSLTSAFSEQCTSLLILDLVGRLDSNFVELFSQNIDFLIWALGYSVSAGCAFGVLLMVPEDRSGWIVSEICKRTREISNQFHFDLSSSCGRFILVSLSIGISC